MADALEAGYDLAGLALCGLALGLLLTTKELALAIANLLDFSLFGFHPLRGLGNAIENAANRVLNGAIKSTERATAKFESGLIDSFGLLIAIPALLYLGTRAALEYLWNHALGGYVHGITNPIRTVANAAATAVADLAGTVKDNLTAAETYARTHATAALDSAIAYVDSAFAVWAEVLRRDIAAGVGRAERYADEAVSKLRTAEDAAVASAVAVAGAAREAGLAAAAAAEAEAIAEAGVLVDTARQAEAAALAAADAAGKAALDVVRSVAVTAENELETALGTFSPAQVAALIASIPAIATMVNAIATEAGLENAECRTKVKGICGTDPGSWGALLEGALFVTGAFSLAELVPIGRGAVHELAGVIRQAA